MRLRKQPSRALADSRQTAWTAASTVVTCRDTVDVLL
jgi:hypothetical protein